MRIAYCTNVRLPTERAHGHQVASVCRALHTLGHVVTIFAPFRRNIITEDFWTYHSLPRDISLYSLGRFDPIASPWLPGVLGLWFMNFSFRRALRRELHPSAFNLVYTRSFALLPSLLCTKIPTILELHSLPRFRRRTFVRTCNRCARVVCLTRPMAVELIEWGVERTRVIVEGDAVDIDVFTKAPDKPEAQRSLGIPNDASVIVYAGQLRSMGLSKGVEELLQAFAILQRRGRPFHALIAGGPPHEIPRLQAEHSTLLPCVRFLGPLPHTSIPTLLSTADVLVYPAPKSDHPFYRRDTSPLKLYEYMASRRPIVCADLEPLRDIIDADTATLVPPGDGTALANGIEATLDDALTSGLRADRAFDRVQHHTWTERMKRILQPFLMA